MDSIEPIRRHHMLNREWWTPARKVKGIIITLGALSLAIISTVGAMDLINNRCIQPDFEKRFEKCYHPYRVADSVKDQNFQERTALQLMKIDKSLEVNMNDEAKAVRDAAFKKDSVIYMRGKRGE